MTNSRTINIGKFSFVASPSDYGTNVSVVYREKELHLAEFKMKEGCELSPQEALATQDTAEDLFLALVAIREIVQLLEGGVIPNPPVQPEEFVADLKEFLEIASDLKESVTKTKH